MIAIGLGVGVLALLLWAANAFSRASVSSIKGLLAWVAALGGLSLAAMLFLTGRGAAAIGGLVLLGPLAWSFWQENRLGVGRVGAGRASGSRKMGRAEALAVLGLAEGASESDIKAAWVRLMRAVHPGWGRDGRPGEPGQSGEGRAAAGSLSGV